MDFDSLNEELRLEYDNAVTAVIDLAYEDMVEELNEEFENLLKSTQYYDEG